MKKKHFLTLAVIIALSGIFTVSNARQYFESFQGLQAPSKGKQVLTPATYRVFSADNQALKSFLHLLKPNVSQEQIIQLPAPDGSFRTFKIWKTSMMEDRMQEAYAGIETFTAVALDNPRVTAKLDFTFFGFHAMVLDGNNTYFIDPYSDVADGYYTVYFKKDYRRANGNYMSCALTEGEIPDANGNFPEQINGGLPDLNAKQFGTTQRVYRLALSCTGEYAQAVGGATPTTLTVLSAMTTTMNRVNGIYQLELGIKMEFISNEDNLIYLNPNTDPFFSNNDGADLLDENANNTTNVIGNANYDIGHIFSTGGGGIAFLGSVCKNNNSNKARGVTGSGNPVGDAFDVDYVAHEMGHQFGAPHTFNSNSGACQGNGFQNNAFETGSGTTIMAYAGICGGDNIQNNSDAYFHAASLDKISDYVTGQTCGTTDIGVSVPDMPGIADTFYIPITTAFELIAPEATTDSTNAISYCWEQWNLGNFQIRESRADTFSAGPCFRSFTPVPERVRVFPPIQMVIDNDFSEKGIRMPSVARALDFKVTARSVYEGWGSFNISDDNVHVNVVSSSGPFIVTAPNTATDSFQKGGTATITWDVANTTSAPVSTPNVDIFLSVDGGHTYPFTLATAVPNDGSETVTLPDTVTSQARVKVKGSGNIFFDISNSNFKIQGDPLGLSEIILNSNISVYPNPAKDMIRIENAAGTALSLALYNVLGQKVWTGEMKQNIAVPLGNLSRGVYYLQMTEQQSGAKVVKAISLQ